MTLLGLQCFYRSSMMILDQMSLVMRKPAFCICENKDTDQLCGHREADQRLYFRYTDSTIHLLPKYEISSLQPSSVVVQPGLCRTWSETLKTGFPTTRLRSFAYLSIENISAEWQIQQHIAHIFAFVGRPGLICYGRRGVPDGMFPSVFR